MMQEYTLLVAFKENLPGNKAEDGISEDEVAEYHQILEAISRKGFDVSVYKVPDEKLKFALRSYNNMTGGNKVYSEKRYCTRGFLLRKLDALLLFFRLQSADTKVEVIGFNSERI